MFFKACLSLKVKVAERPAEVMCNFALCGITSIMIEWFKVLWHWLLNLALKFLLLSSMVCGLFLCCNSHKEDNICKFHNMGIYPFSCTDVQCIYDLFDPYSSWPYQSSLWMVLSGACKLILIWTKLYSKLVFCTFSRSYRLFWMSILYLTFQKYNQSQLQSYQHWKYMNKLD